MASDYRDREKENLELRHRIREAEAMVQRLQERRVVTDRLASIGMRVASVAHEINNPLAYVVANLDYLARRLPPSHESGGSGAEDELRNVLAEAQEGVKRIRCIVRDLRASSRSDEGQRGPVDLHRRLDSAANMARNEIRHRARLDKVVLDDEPLVAAALRRIIGPHHHVECVTRPAEALERVASDPAFDVIFCDLMMPDMAGATFWAELQRVRPALASRGVFVTGGAFTPAAHDFLATLPTPPILKPFDPEQIQQVIDELMARRGELLARVEETPPCRPRG